jgi:hypothetical protein
MGQQDRPRLLIGADTNLLDAFVVEVSTAVAQAKMNDRVAADQRSWRPLAPVPTVTRAVTVGVLSRPVMLLGQSRALSQQDRVSVVVRVSHHV